MEYLGLASDNVATFSNVRGCGQIVTDHVNFSNVSMSACSFDISSLEPAVAVPLPASLPLMLTGLAVLGFIRSRRRAA